MTTEDWRPRVAQAFEGATSLLGGSASNFDVSIDSIKLENGDKIDLQPSGVTAIVGPNNAGKSTILRETFELLHHRSYQAASPRISVTSLQLRRSGDASDVVSWLGVNANFVSQQFEAGFVRADTDMVRPDTVAELWETDPNTLGQLRSFLAFYGNAQGRFNIGGTVEKRESVDDPPLHALHYLEDSKRLFQRVNHVSKDVFGATLTLDTLGRTVKLRVGELSSEMPRIDEIGPEFRAEMGSLRPLDEQGDGMRSLMGQLLPVVTGAYRIVLLDEPEAFLHPPQAHALGIELGKLAVENKVQILIATHDRALLTGLLDSEVDVSVVRLSRQDDAPTARRLDAHQLRDLWSDPVLKYTNILEGLFHRLVVVAEAEGDCAYLAAALDCEGRNKGPLPRNEILFVPTGGKDGIPKVCRALTAVGVPTVAAPDLDALSDQGKLRTLVESLGGDWTDDIRKDWKVATESIRNSKEPATVEHVLNAIDSALSSRKSEYYSSDIKEEVIAQLRTSDSPWAQVKKHGLSMFKGKEFTAVTRLLDALAAAGLVLVREGELERLAPEVEASKGPGWLPAALRQEAQCNSTTQAHVDRILDAARKKLHT
ncbi:AAA family ATPase [Microbacter sp. ANSKLAB05]|nr:AAA family ATPase [Microbacter sp. ANSKLAB05]